MNRRGIALAGQGLLREAVDCFEQALAAEPNYAIAHKNLGYARELMGDLEAAISCYRRSVEIDPKCPGVQDKLGTLFAERGDLRLAGSYFQAAATTDTSNASSHRNLGYILAKLGRHEAAAAALNRAAELCPDSLDVLVGLGRELALSHDYAGAERCLQQLLEKQLIREPIDATTHVNLGLLFKELGQLSEALAHYDRAMALQPDHFEAQKARALALLLMQDFERGWPAYEARLKVDDLRATHSAPRWDGAPLDGRTLLVETEQGMGDTIQFVRYTAEIKRLHRGRIILACEPQLVPLLKCVQGVDILIGQSEARPAFDLWTSLMSLPGVFGHQTNSFPAIIPYVRAEPQRVKKWRTALATAPGLKIGITWQGSKSYTRDRKRSFAVAEFAPLARLPGVTLISLQKGDGEAQIDSSHFQVMSLGPDFDAAGGAFLDTAAVMMSLDLVISADTSIAHLAGALGVRVWVALPYVPDWRWGMQGDRTPWYPTMRLFRQSQPGDWNGVFAAIREALRGHAALA